MIEAWFDGCTEPVNPGGYGAYGALVKVDGKVVFAEGKFVGHGPRISNNVSEYAGCIAVLKQIREISGVAIVRGDSKLVINQLMGKWAIHGGLYVPFYLEAAELFRPLKERCRLEWIPRDENSICDVYSKKVLRDMGIEFKLQRETA